MFFKKIKNNYIIKSNQKTIDLKLLAEIEKFQNTLNKKARVAIDCTNLNEIEDRKSVEKIIKYGISLFDSSCLLTAQIGLLSYENFPKMYLSLEDFIEDKRILTRRRFKVA